MENKKYYIQDICLILKVGTATINNWYRWYNNELFTKPADIPTLPKPHKESNAKNSKRYWLSEDVKALIIFKQYISDHKGKKGVMGELNCRGWPKNMAYRTLLKKGRMDLIEEYKLDNLEKED